MASADRPRADGDQGTTARSTNPTARYSATETIAVSRIAPNTRSVLKLFCETFIQMPRPSVAPTYSPKIAPITAYTALIRRPVNSDGSADGQRSFRNVWRAVAPIDRMR